MPALLLRLAGLPTRSLIAVLSAALLLLVVLASVPALVASSFTANGKDRSDSLIRQITAWTRTLLTPTTPDPEPRAAAHHCPTAQH